MSLIKNIIFDFGGVILNIDHQRVEKAFERFGLENFEQLFNKASQTDMFKDLEKGIKSPEEFRDQIRSFTGLKLTDATIDHTWNQIICDYPPARIELLKVIRENYRLFLLSNTNIIHYNYYIPKFRSEFGYDFELLFNGLYWSFQIGMRKPDSDIFAYLFKNESIDPKETLFIDDSVQNILAAKKNGLRTFHLKDGIDLISLFENGILKNSALTDKKSQL